MPLPLKKKHFLIFFLIQLTIFNFEKHDRFGQIFNEAPCFDLGNQFWKFPELQVFRLFSGVVANLVFWSTTFLLSGQFFRDFFSSYNNFYFYFFAQQFRFELGPFNNCLIHQSGHLIYLWTRGSDKKQKGWNWVKYRWRKNQTL